MARASSSQQDVISQLIARFDQPLGDFARRRVVVWHDADGAFEGAFDEIAESGLELDRVCAFAKTEEGSLFELKRRICRVDAESDFLVYTRSPKDFSVRGLEGNWLADLELIAEHFQADFSSMLLDDIGASDAALEGVERFKTFFGSEERKKKFMKLMPAAQTKEDVALGVMGSVLGASDLTTSGLIKVYLGKLLDGADALADLAKYDADGSFISFMQSRIGYAGDLESMDDLMAHIAISALSCTMPEGSLDGLESRMSPVHGQFCLNVIEDWMRDDSAAEDLYELLRRVEQSCNLEQRFSQLGVQAFSDSDVLPCINECILADLMASIAHGSDRADEASVIAKRRKDLAWYGRVSPYFDALSYAVKGARFFREHAQGFHYAVPADVWKAYADDWYRMDSYYRGFCKACDACLRCPSDVPAYLSEALEALGGWMERIYTNWFLSESNACWVNACEKQWLTQGYVEGVDLQRRFFEEKVLSGAGGAKKTLVLISDAMRYEVAAELAERLERDTKGSAELGSMQGVYPTITEFGMAALLPHNTMSYNCDEGVVSCNGMPAMSTKEREVVLRARKPKSRALQSKDLIDAKRAERKELVADAEYVYVYHNVIDATGEAFATERNVFGACDTAIDDLVALVKIALSDLSISRVVITADHGFIYTRDALAERDKVSKADIGAESVKHGRRYAILDGVTTGDTIFVKMNMDDMAGGEYTGLSPRECIRIKQPGPGGCYVHGGVSLQEMCVPVIQFRNRKGGSAGYVEQQTAELKLLTPSRRINSMLFKLDLFQPIPVGGKVLPAQYELMMTDASGNEVSNVVKAHADMANTEETARVSHLQFSLKAGRQYNSKEMHYLVCREKNTMQLVWKEEFQIDIAFAPMDDFGF